MAQFKKDALIIQKGSGTTPLNSNKVAIFVDNSDDKVKIVYSDSSSGTLAFESFVGSVSGNLQTQIDNITINSSGGIASINDIKNSLGNIDLISSDNSLNITPNDLTKQIDLTVSSIITDSITDIETDVISLSGQIDILNDTIINLQPEIGSYVTDINSISGAVNLIGGDGVIVSNLGNNITISISGNYGIQGRLDCNASDLTYTITHPEIDPATSFPVVSLDIPSSGSNLFVQGVYDRQATSFKVVLSDFPTSSYGILWHLSSLLSSSPQITGNFVSKEGDTITGNLTVEADVAITSGGRLSINDVLYETGSYTGIVNNTLFDTVPVTQANAAFWDVLIDDGTNFRASRVSAVWDNSGDPNRVKYNEQSTESIGDTVGIDLVVSLSGSDIRLKGQVTSGVWNIRFIRKVI